MAWPIPSLWFDTLAGVNVQHVDRARQDAESLEAASVLNCINDPPGEWVTRPGFSKVNATTIASSPALTGIHPMGDVAAETILTCSDGTFKRNDADPPSALTGGTAFTTGHTVLTRSDICNNQLIVVSNARNIPQTVTSSVVRADLTGTPPRGIDVKSFARRVCIFSPSDGSTIYPGFMSMTSIVDSNTSWIAPYTLNFLNFGRPGASVKVLGGEIFKDHLMTFTENEVFPVYATPNALLPMAFQDASFREIGGGPPNIQAVVNANDHLYWISKNFDIKVMDGNKQVKSIGWPIQPFLRGLNDNRRVYTVGGYEPQYRMVVWAVSDGSDTQNNTVVAMHVDTGNFFFHTLSRNAFALRTVGGELRLTGGGYAGYLYNDYLTGETTGNLDDSTAAIDADIKLPRFHLGLPSARKKCRTMYFEFDPISTESIAITGNYDDETAYTSLSTTVTASGSDVLKVTIPITRPFERIAPRVRCNTSGQRMRLMRIGFDTPTVVQHRR